MNAVDVEMLLEHSGAITQIDRAAPSDWDFFKAVPVTTKLPSALVWFVHWNNAGRRPGWSFLTTRAVKDATGLADYSVEWGVKWLRSSGWLTQSELLTFPQGSRWARRVHCPITRSWGDGK